MLWLLTTLALGQDDCPELDRLLARAERDAVEYLLADARKEWIEAVQAMGCQRVTPEQVALLWRIDAVIVYSDPEKEGDPAASLAAAARLDATSWNEDYGSDLRALFDAPAPAPEGEASLDVRNLPATWSYGVDGRADAEGLTPGPHVVQVFDDEGAPRYAIAVTVKADEGAAFTVPTEITRDAVAAPEPEPVARPVPEPVATPVPAPAPAPPTDPMDLVERETVDRVTRRKAWRKSRSDWHTVWFDVGAGPAFTVADSTYRLQTRDLYERYYVSTYRLGQPVWGAFHLQLTNPGSRLLDVELSARNGRTGTFDELRLDGNYGNDPSVGIEPVPAGYDEGSAWLGIRMPFRPTATTRASLGFRLGARTVRSIRLVVDGQGRPVPESTQSTGYLAGIRIPVERESWMFTLDAAGGMTLADAEVYGLADFALASRWRVVAPVWMGVRIDSALYNVGTDIGKGYSHWTVGYIRPALTVGSGLALGGARDADR